MPILYNYQNWKLIVNGSVLNYSAQVTTIGLYVKSETVAPLKYSEKTFWIIS